MNIKFNDTTFEILRTIADNANRSIPSVVSQIVNESLKPEYHRDLSLNETELKYRK